MYDFYSIGHFSFTASSFLISTPPSFFIFLPLPSHLPPSSILFLYHLILLYFLNLLFLFIFHLCYSFLSTPHLSSLYLSYSLPTTSSTPAPPSSHHSSPTPYSLHLSSPAVSSLPLLHPFLYLFHHPFCLHPLPCYRPSFATSPILNTSHHTSSTPSSPPLLLLSHHTAPPLPSSHCRRRMTLTSRAVFGLICSHGTYKNSNTS